MNVDVNVIYREHLRWSLSQYGYIANLDQMMSVKLPASAKGINITAEIKAKNAHRKHGVSQGREQRRGTVRLYPRNSTGVPLS